MAYHQPNDERQPKQTPYGYPLQPANPSPLAFPPQASSYPEPPQYEMDQGSGKNHFHPPPLPSHGGEGPHVAPPPPESRFSPPTGPQDVWAAILFVLHLIAFLAVAGVSYDKVDWKTMTPKGSSLDSAPPRATVSSKSNVAINFNTSAISAVVAGAVAAVLLSFSYLVAMRKWPKQLIKFTFWLAIAYFLAPAVLFALYGQIWAAVIIAIIVVIYIIAYRAFRARMPFAAVILSTVADVTTKYGGTITVSFFGLIIQLAYVAFWAISMIAICFNFRKLDTSSSYNRTSFSSSTTKRTFVMSFPLTLFIIFSFYWTVQVLRNIIHVTVSGVFASYYFLSGSPQGMPAYPTMGAFKRAVTTSFGSICFGSLLITLVQMVRSMFHQALNNSNSALGLFLLCCSECLLAWIQSLVEYFNHYAFTQVAIYGKPFMRAGKDTWTLIMDRGVDVIINDSLIGHVLVFGALMTGGITLLVSWGVYAIGGATGGATDTPTLAVVLGIGFGIGAIMFFCASEVIRSGVATTFVCLAEDPAALRATKPELWEKVRETYPQAAFASMYT